MRDHELGHSREHVGRRLDRLSGELELELDRERARHWAFGQTMVWAMRGGVGTPRHIERARWLLDAR